MIINLLAFLKGWSHLDYEEIKVSVHNLFKRVMCYIWWVLELCVD